MLLRCAAAQGGRRRFKPYCIIFFSQWQVFFGGAVWKSSISSAVTLKTSFSPWIKGIRLSISSIICNLFLASSKSILFTSNSFSFIIQKNSHLSDCHLYFVLIIAFEIVVALDSISWCELLTKREAPIPIAANTSQTFCKTVLFMFPAPYISYYIKSRSLWEWLRLQLT